jgi:hypothetical protein
MAKVESVFRIRGTIDDLTFRQTQDGTVAQRKPGPTREQVLHAETYHQTRIHAMEFTRAIHDARLLREALGAALHGVKSSSLNGRMNGLLFAAALKDPDNDWGYRHISAGDASKLAGFDFNKALRLASAFPVKFEHSLDAATGLLQVKLPSFIMRKKKVFPDGVTHFRIVSCGVMINFMDACYWKSIKTSNLLPFSRKIPGPICMEHTLPAGPDDVLVQVMGIEFYKQVNENAVLVNGGAMRILEAAKMSS